MPVIKELDNWLIEKRIKEKYYAYCFKIFVKSVQTVLHGLTNKYKQQPVLEIGTKGEGPTTQTFDVDHKSAFRIVLSLMSQVLYWFWDFVLFWISYFKTRVFP